MKTPKEKRNIYDITYEIRGEREDPKPYRDIKKVSPYKVNKKTERRIEVTAKSNGHK